MGGQSIFDGVTKDDLIIAFFPCIYFTGSVNPCYMRLDNTNYRGLTLEQKFEAILKRIDLRNDFYKTLYKMVGTVLKKDFRIIIENPYDDSMHFLHNNFLAEPAVYDINRQMRGDFYRKPTGYWYFNCNPTFGCSFQEPSKKLVVWESKSGKQAGICSEERSMISPDYARNFICDFILGKEQNLNNGMLF